MDNVLDNESDGVTDNNNNNSGGTTDNNDDSAMDGGDGATDKDGNSNGAMDNNVNNDGNGNDDNGNHNGNNGNNDGNGATTRMTTTLRSTERTVMVRSKEAVPLYHWWRRREEAMPPHLHLKERRINIISSPHPSIPTNRAFNSYIEFCSRQFVGTVSADLS